MSPSPALLDVVGVDTHREKHALVVVTAATRRFWLSRWCVRTRPAVGRGLP